MLETGEHSCFKSATKMPKMMTDDDLIRIEDDARISVVTEKLHAQLDAGQKIKAICG